MKPVDMEDPLCIHINDLFRVVTLIAYTLFDTNIAIIPSTFKITFQIVVGSAQETPTCFTIASILVLYQNSIDFLIL